MKELTLEITNYCDKYCPWCSSMSHNHGKHVDLDTVVKQLTKYRKVCCDVRLSGGEPTSHPNYLEIINKAIELGYEYVEVLTSGASKYAFPIVGGVSYTVNMVDSDSYAFVKALIFLKRPVRMHVVIANGNEENLLKSVQLALQEKISLRLLKVQVQGRAEAMKGKQPYWSEGWDMPLISWTGDKGCSFEDKVTVTHDGRVVTCSALKYKDTCGLVTLVCKK